LAASVAPEQVPQDAGLLLFEVARGTREVGGVLEAVVAVVSVEVRDVIAWLACLLL